MKLLRTFWHRLAHAAFNTHKQTIEIEVSGVEKALVDFERIRVAADEAAKSIERLNRSSSLMH